MRRVAVMATEQSYAVFGLAEHELRSELEEELVRATRGADRARDRPYRCPHPRARPSADGGAARAGGDVAGTDEAGFEHPMTELRIRVDSSSQCPRLAGFLRRCRAQPRMLDEHSSRSNSMTTGVPGSRRSSRRLRSGGARRARARSRSPSAMKCAYYAPKREARDSCLRQSVREVAGRGANRGR